MCRTRLILSVAVLFLYLVQVIGGRPLHWWLDGAGSLAYCCGPSAVTNAERTKQACCHGYQRHALRPGDQGTQGSYRKGSLGDQRGHDPSTCRVCQVLGQPQVHSVEQDASPSLAVARATLLYAHEYYPLSRRTGLHSRAPPIDPTARVTIKTVVS